jgi:HEAT repeat protein
VIVRRETAGVLGSRGLVRFDTNATAEQLQKLYADSEIAIPALITACADPDEFVRTKAAIALGLLGQKPQLVIPVLVKMLAEDKSSWRVPSAAATALGRFGVDAVPAIPELQQALEHSDSRVRESAKAALQSIQATNRAQNETSR